MSKPIQRASSNRKTIVVLVAASLLVLGGAAFGVVSLVKARRSAVPAEFTIAALKADAKDPHKMFEKVHEAMSRPELSDQQREAIHDNARAVMEAQMDVRMNAYFAAPQAQRKAIIDRDLDEMQARMKEWQQRRPRDESGRAPGDRPQGSARRDAQAPGSPPPGGGPQADRRGGPRGDHNSTPQERKTRSESRDPDKTARRTAYFTAMRQRAEERGIQMPFRGGGPGH